MYLFCRGFGFLFCFLGFVLFCFFVIYAGFFLISTIFRLGIIWYFDCVYTFDSKIMCSLKLLIVKLSLLLLIFNLIYTWMTFYWEWGNRVLIIVYMG